ncbi:hypothetical protein EGI22_17845 [Lacihabitans sp. LS3-19]|uniref:hypothetical protein n=1 Tax=Lacihabitans sp. LS3-19 TaxID=2487335 RepID=UPI0020CE141E|nr:hypothetical protein [Lacihabitans sp. LS3-19]MCP9769771.1 hypothetical protein [Lacihabitans sp. LS3-19]
MKKIIYFLTMLFLSMGVFAQSFEITPNSSSLNSTTGNNSLIRSNDINIGISGRRFRGTLAAPTTPLLNDYLFSLNGGGNYTSSNHSDQASIRFQATENWGFSNNGTKISFWNTPNGSFSLNERMVINHDGNVGVGISSPSSLFHLHEKQASTVANFQITNPDAGTTASDGLNLSLNYNSLFFPKSAQIMNRENGELQFGANNTVHLAMTPTGNIRIGALIPQSGKMVIEGNSSCCAGSPSSTLTLHESEAVDGSRLRFTNVNSTQTSRFWDIYGYSAGSGSDANATMTFYYGGTGQNTLNLKGDGKVGIGTSSPGATLEVNGFTKLGSDAPKIKVKKLIGTTASTQGGSVTIAHGVTSSKIISISALVRFNGSAADAWVGNGYTGAPGFEFSYLYDGSFVYIVNTSGNSTSILSKDIKVVITYEE